MDNVREKQHDFEEFKLLYESTVKVTEWRNSVNRFHFSVIVAIIAAIGLSFFYGYIEPSDPSTKIIAEIGIAILSITGAFVTRTWLKLLEYYYGLNTAKFEALKVCDPQNVFELEYKILMKLRKEGKVANIKAKSAEKIIPYFSLAVFIFTLIIACFSYLGEGCTRNCGLPSVPFLR
jgi:hypothetical protein